ncbi:MAG: fused MFS/spermidine synthase [Pseudomonadota bacterium]
MPSPVKAEAAPQQVQEPERRILFDRTSPFARVLVSDEGPLRVLRFGSFDAATQSAIIRGQPRAVPVEYVRYSLLGLAHHGHPRHILMVGLGGGTFSTLVHRALPEINVDVVEIDAVVAEAARAFFGLREEENYRVHLADAAAWMARDGERYDFVLLDAYAGDDIPTVLGEPPFFQAVARRLALDGVVALNIAQPEGAGVVVARNFRRVFTPFDCRQTPRDGNVVIFGADAARRFDPAARARWLAAWDARAPTDFSLRALAGDVAGRVRPQCDRLLAGSAASASP